MDLPVFGFDENPDDEDSRLILFEQTAGKVGSISYKVRPTLEEAISANKTYLTSIGFKEKGALKENVTMQVSKGGKTTNYGRSKKRECSYTLISTKNGTGSNVNAAIDSDSLYADCILMDTANGFIYEMRNLEVESGVKIEGAKAVEMPFKCTADSFARPMRAVKIVGTNGEIISVPDTSI